MKQFCDLALLSYFDLKYECNSVEELIRAIQNDDNLVEEKKYMPEFAGNYAMLKTIEPNLYKDFTIQTYWNDNQYSGVVYYIFSCAEYDIYVFRGSEGYDHINHRCGWQDWADNLRMFRKQATMQQCFAYDQFQQHKPQRPYYLCGHSKGGNLALFCSLVMKDEDLKYLKGVYTFNAPGIHSAMIQLYQQRANDQNFINLLHIYENEHDTISSFFEHLQQPIYVRSNQQCNTFVQLFHCHNLYAYDFSEGTYIQCNAKSVMPYIVHQFVYNYFINLSEKRLERMIRLGDDYFNSELSAEELYKVLIYQISIYTSLFDNISYNEIKSITLQDLIDRRKSARISKKIKEDINRLQINTINQAISDTYDYFVKKKVNDMQRMLSINNKKIKEAMEQINKTKTCE